MTNRAEIRSMYCTVLSQARVPHALALQKSISAHSPDSKFGFFCIDDATAVFLEALGLRNSWIFKPGEFVPAVVQAARPRLGIVEYCAICKPQALMHALRTVPDLSWAVWVDSDMFAFGNPDSALVANANANVLLTPHRFFLDEFARFEPSVGRFNAGYVAFRNTSEGLAALTWWMERCLEGCPLEPTEHLFGDQKYLNLIPERFSGVAEAGKGVNCAPWNVFGFKAEQNHQCVSVSDEPLVLYHFQGFRVIRHWAFDLYASRLKLPDVVRRLIYKPYVAALAAELAFVRRSVGNPHVGIDEQFLGAGSLARIARQLAQTRNIMMQPLATLTAAKSYRR